MKLFDTVGKVYNAVSCGCVPSTHIDLKDSLIKEEKFINGESVIFSFYSSKYANYTSKVAYFNWKNKVYRVDRESYYDINGVNGTVYFFTKGNIPKERGLDSA